MLGKSPTLILSPVIIKSLHKELKPCEGNTVVNTYYGAVEKIVHCKVNMVLFCAFFAFC